MGAITGADVSLTLSILPLFPIPQAIQGFANDDAFDLPQVRSVETMMGVDGVLSAGFVFVPIPHSITLQADSDSNRIFETWWTQMQAGKATYIATGLIKMPAIATKFVLSQGYLTGYKAAPTVKRLLQPRTYEITWRNVSPAPT